MTEQTTLGVVKKPKVNVLINLHAAKLCVMFPETGIIACLPFSAWEDKSLIIGGKRLKNPHHKVTVLVPAEYVSLINTNEEFTQKVRELQPENREIKAKPDPKGSMVLEPEG